MYKKIFIVLFIVVLVFLLGLFCYLFTLNTSYLQVIDEQLYGKNTSLKNYDILAIIKIESNFNKDIISSKGASGLMQIMPSTAEFIIQNLLLESNLQNNYNIFDAKTNIKLGVNYLFYLENNFSNIEYILAGYNAGPNVAKKWQSNNLSYKNFPYKETRDYVKRYYIYKKLYKFKLDIISVFV